MLYVYLTLSVFTLALIGRLLLYIYQKRKAYIFWKKHFFEDRIYTKEEVARVFTLDTTHFHKHLLVLQKFGYFKRFNEEGVTMIKDYYSSYELKRLVSVILKSNKLKLSF